MDIMVILKTSLQGFFPILAISLAGVFLSYKNVLNSETNQKLSACFANFFSPFLSVVYISSSFDISEFSII